MAMREWLIHVTFLGSIAAAAAMAIASGF